jgi:4-diphosphocytidyl-2C-methyl-D-erythritol kinase
LRTASPIEGSANGTGEKITLQSKPAAEHSGQANGRFHELETVMHPVSIFDELSFDRAGKGIELTCSEPTLPTDSRNLVVRAAETFFEAATVNEGVKIHLEKKLPLAAGLGGGSGNAATTLLALNELFGAPLSMEQLQEIAGEIGSDVPFFCKRNRRWRLVEERRSSRSGPLRRLRTPGSC